jgi:hypothetical protein
MSRIIAARHKVTPPPLLRTWDPSKINRLFRKSQCSRHLILPGIDAGAFAATARFGLWHGSEASHDPTAGLGWIYHFIDLQNGGEETAFPLA